MKITTKTTKSELAAELARKQECIERLQDNLHHIASQLVERTAELGRRKKDAEAVADSLAYYRDRRAYIEAHIWGCLALAFLAGIAATLLGVG